MRTTPEDIVPEPYDDTAIQSISTWRSNALARSAITMTAPFEHPDQEQVRPS
jgi:hypothetical protein